MNTILVGPNLEIERAFVALLKAAPDLADLTIVAASDREAEVPPLHCFVICDEAVPQLPTGPIYKANVAVTLVTNIDDHTTALRTDWWSKVLKVVGKAPEFQEFDSGNAIIKGWVVKVVGEVSSGQQTGDVARLSVGVIL